MKCPKCGFENLEEANFCIKCGHRIDGKVPCPKCREYIPNDAEHCPHCGKAIPHFKTSDEVSNEQAKTRRDNIANIFNFVSCFVTLFIFIFAISATFTRHFLDYAGNGLIDFIPTPSFINDFKAASGTIRAGMIIGLSVAAIDFIVCLVFSIIGVVKAAKAFKNRELIIDAYKYMVIVLASKIVTSTLLNLNSSGYSYYTMTEMFIGLTLCHLFVCIAFDCFLNFKKGAVSVFVARVILGIGIVFPLLILNLMGESTIFVEQSEGFVGTQGLIQHFTDLTGRLIVYGPTAELVSYVVCCVSMVFMAVIISLTYSFLVYYTVSYFRGMNRFRKFRIAFYMSDITLSIFATGYLISTIVEYQLYRNYLNTTQYSSYGDGPVWVFIYSILLVGVAVATFNIYNRAAKRAKLAEKTTKVE